MTETTTRRVWVGCLACYNAGDLVGAWYDASDAGSVTTQRVHDAGSGPSVNAGGYVGTDWDESPHEELWCFDLEGFPSGVGEISPAEAERIDALMTAAEAVGPSEAFAAFLDNFHGSVTGADEDAVSEFEEAYVGEFDSFRDYADELADDMIPSLSQRSGASDAENFLARYFDYDSWARDLILGGDYWTHEAGGRVYVFRSL